MAKNLSAFPENRTLDDLVPDYYRTLVETQFGAFNGTEGIRAKYFVDYVRLLCYFPTLLFCRMQSKSQKPKPSSFSAEASISRSPRLELSLSLSLSLCLRLRLSLRLSLA
jgi:hypothetical protein